eukprot:747473-Hanusia_phi.AAC.1
MLSWSRSIGLRTFCASATSNHESFALVKGKAASKKWLEASFPNCKVKIPPRSPPFQFDHVLFDMNHLLHCMSRDAKDAQTVCKRVFREVDYMLQKFIPLKSVVLTFDGPGPIAKIRKQIESREKKPSKMRSSGIGSIDITPGTRFMYQVRELCLMHVAHRLDAKRKFQDVSFYISCSDVAGEGELKLMEWIHTFVEKKSQDTILFIGGDSDLTIQSLALRDLPHVYLFDTNLEHANKGKQVAASHFFSLAQLKSELEMQFPHQSDLVRADLMLLIIFNGNDYLPKLKCFNLPCSFQVYKEERFRRRFLLNGPEQSFDWEFLAEFLKELDERWKALQAWNPVSKLFSYLHRESSLYTVKDVRFEYLRSLEDEQDVWQCTAVIGTLRFEGEKLQKKLLAKSSAAEVALAKVTLLEHASLDINHRKDAFKSPSVDKTQLSDPESNLAPELIEGYLQGVLWNVQMYIDGFVPDFDFMYSFGVGPNLASIVDWISSKYPKPNLKAVTSNSRPLSPAEICLALTPLYAADRLPSQYREVIVDEASQFHQHFKAKSGPFQSNLFLPLFRKELSRIDPDLMTEEEKIIAGKSAVWSLLFHVSNHSMHRHVQQGVWEGGKNTEWSMRPIPLQSILAANVKLVEEAQAKILYIAK